MAGQDLLTGLLKKSIVPRDRKEPLEARGGGLGPTPATPLPGSVTLGKLPVPWSCLLTCKIVPSAQQAGDKPRISVAHGCQALFLTRTTRPSNICSGDRVEGAAPTFTCPGPGAAHIPPAPSGFTSQSKSHVCIWLEKAGKQVPWTSPPRA